MSHRVAYPDSLISEYPLWILYLEIILTNWNLRAYLNRKKNKINKHSTTESLALLPVRKQVLFQIKNIYKVFVIKLAINILYKRKMWRVIPILFQEHFLRTSIFFQCSLLKGRAFQIEKSFWISSSYLMLCRATGK